MIRVEKAAVCVTMVLSFVSMVASIVYFSPILFIISLPMFAGMAWTLAIDKK